MSDASRTLAGAPTKLLLVLDRSVREDDAAAIVASLADRRSVAAVEPVLETNNGYLRGYFAEQDRWNQGLRALVPDWITPRTAHRGNLDD